MVPVELFKKYLLTLPSKILKDNIKLQYVGELGYCLCT